MLALIRTTLGGGGDTKRLLALGALLALLAAALLTLAPAAADGHPDDLELILSIVDDSDNIVPPGSEFTVEAELRFSLPHTQERRLSAATDSWLRLAGDLHWKKPPSSGSTSHSSWSWAVPRCSASTPPAPRSAAPRGWSPERPTGG